MDATKLCSCSHNFFRDYAANELLDRYSDADLDDQNDFDDMAPAARRAAEAKMSQRDRRERRGGKKGSRAAGRSRMPEFLQSDEEDDDVDMDGLGVSKMKTRTRRQYDERRDIDDLDGVEDVSRHISHSYIHADVSRQEIPLEQLSDIKAKSIVEWIANDRVRRSIIRHFRQFLMTYVDEHGSSVYGQRIRNLGESE